MAGGRLFRILYVINKAEPAERYSYVNAALLLTVDALQVNARRAPNGRLLHVQLREVGRESEGERGESLIAKDGAPRAALQAASETAISALPRFRPSDMGWSLTPTPWSTAPTNGAAACIRLEREHVPRCKERRRNLALFGIELRHQCPLFGKRVCARYMWCRLGSTRNVRGLCCCLLTHSLSIAWPSFHFLALSQWATTRIISSLWFFVLAWLLAAAVKDKHRNPPLLEHKHSRLRRSV